MANTSKNVGIRLSVDNAEQATADMKEFGTEGQAALAGIAEAAEPASASLLALSGTINAAKESTAEFAAEGKAGFAEFAGLITPGLTGFLALGGAVEATRKSLDDFTGILNSAKTAGVTTTLFQALAAQAQQSDISVDQLASALATFSKNAGLAEASQGRLYTQLKALDPELLKQIQSTSDQGQRIRDVADAISKQTDASKAATIATAAFGSAGEQMVKMFQGGSAAIEDTIASAKDMGLIVPQGLLENADELGNKLTTVSNVLKLQFEKGLVELAPDLVQFVGLLTDAVDWLDKVNKAVQDFNEAPFKNDGIVTGADLDEAQQELSTFMGGLQARLAAGNAAGDLPPDFTADTLKQLESIVSGLDGTAASAKTAESALESLGSANPDFQSITSQIVYLISQLNRLKTTASAQGLTPDQLLFRNADEASMHTLPAPAAKPTITPPASATNAAAEAQKKIDNVNKSLDTQIANLTATNEQQEINNELVKAGVTADSAAGKEIAAKASAYFELKQQIDAVNQAEGLFAQTGESAIEDLVIQGKSLSDTFEDVAQSLEKAVLQATLLGQGPLAGFFGTTSATSGQTGGVLGSLLSFFAGGSGAGSGAELAGTGSSYDAGGYTGPGGRYQVAGTVHKGEVVWSQADVARHGGAGIVDAMRRGLPGYADGGYAGAMPASFPSSPRVSVNVTNNSGQAVDAKTIKVSQSGKGIDVDMVISKQVATPGTATARSLATTYGLKRSLTRR